MIVFKQAMHTVRPWDVVEVWVDGEMLAVIYPNGEDGIKLMSKHVVEEPISAPDRHPLDWSWSFRFKTKKN